MSAASSRRSGLARFAIMLTFLSLLLFPPTGMKIAKAADPTPPTLDSPSSPSPGAPTLPWYSTLKGLKFDRRNDRQATSSIDLLGDENYPLLYMYYDDKGDQVESNDEMLMRVRVGDARTQQGKFDGYVWMGVDVDQDGDLDVFLMLDGKSSPYKLDVYSAGTGLNNSPSTSSIDNPVLLTTLTTGTDFRIDYVADIDGGSASFDGATGKTDDFVSFKFSFQSFAALANAKPLTHNAGTIQSINGGSGLTKNTPLRFVLASAQQTNALNGDIGGYGPGDDQSATYAAMGAFSAPLTLGDPGGVSTPTALGFTTPERTIAAGASSDLITVELRTAQGTPVASVGTTTVNLSAPNATFRNADDTTTITSVTMADGVTQASFRATSTIAGTHSITASASSGLASAMQGLNVNPGAASQLVFGTAPSNAFVGDAISPAVTVRLLDAYGNLTNSTAPVTLSIGASPGGSPLLGGTTTAAAVSGIATFSDLTLDTAGNGYTLQASSAGLTGAASSTFNITSPVLTLTGLTAQNKTYDGTTAATISSYGTLTGFAPGDEVTLVTTGATAAFSDQNVGEGKTVTVTGLALGGAQAGKYTIGAQETTGTITALAITVTADARTKVVGSNDPALTYRVTAGSLVEGDSFAGALIREAGESAGTYAIAQGTLTAGANYVLTFQSASLTIVAPTSLTLDGLTAEHKVYDGTTAAVISRYGNLVGVAPGHMVTLVTTGATAAFSDKNVGDGKTVTVSGLALTGPDAGSYTIGTLTTTANITPINLGLAITSSASTGTSRPTISGTSTAPPGSAVTVTVDGQTYSTMVQANGTWSVQTGSLPDGNHAVTATVQDAMGNSGSSTQTLSVDTWQPPVISRHLAITSPRETGAPRPAISGTTDVPDGSAVAVSVNGHVYRTTARNGSWDVTVTDPLPPGTYVVTASTRDAFGNSAGDTQTLKVTADGILQVAVTTDFGMAVPGVRVEVRKPDGSLAASGTTDGSGRMEIKLPAGTYSVSPLLPGQSGTASATVISGQTTTAGLTLASTLRLSLSADPASIIGDGRSTSTLAAAVATLAGERAAGVGVSMTATAGSLRPGSANTNASGLAFSTLTAPTLTGTVPRTEQVVATVFEPGRGLFARATITIRFVPASVTGTIIDSRTGLPVTGAIASLAEDFDGNGVPDFAADFTTGPDGRYSIAVPRGDWHYTVTIKTPLVVDGRSIWVTSTQQSAIGQVRGTGEQYRPEPAISGLLQVRNPESGRAASLNDVLPAGTQVKGAIRSASGVLLDKQVQVSPEGVFEVQSVPPGTYEVTFQVTMPQGQVLAGTRVRITVSEQGELALGAALIDPYGKVTDRATGQPLQDVRMTLYWADHPTNIAHGRTPNTPVVLPELPSFQPGQNRVPQWTNEAGEYAWMVFPDGWYYLIAEREGYVPYDSRKAGESVPALPGGDSFIQNGLMYVGTEVVQYNVQMEPLAGEHLRYIRGYPDGLFKPERSITRAEVATILTRITGRIGASDNVSLYRDVSPAHWAVPYIKAARARGLMVGDPDGRFRADQPISRAEVAVIALRFKGLSTLTGSAFPDTAGHWAAGTITAVSRAGYVLGYPNGTYRPNQPITRAEFVTVINRLLDRGPLLGRPAPAFPDVTTTHWAYGQVEEAATGHQFGREPDQTERWMGNIYTEID